MTYKASLDALCKTVTGGVFVIFAISGCSSNTEKENDALKNKNQELKNEIAKLKSTSNTFAYQAIVVEKSKRVKLGDDYIADVRLSMADTNQPSLTVLCRLDTVTGELISLGDTLKYDKEFGCSIFKQKAIRKGKQEWAGKIIQKINGKTNEYGFKCKYEVY
jgi:hypothetical protein